ncbi:MAG: Apolipoprotein N-acyltransferase [Candidatus Anoxychlamydiales bacterium]|nr:Apolipoprotein N-acyltransferase [Candidatus Anoxychlamydiales bacterium]
MKNNFFLNISFFVLSFVIVAFSQPAWIGELGIIASCIGYFLFWYSIYDIYSTKVKCTLSFIWFLAVQAIWLSWFTSTKYQGKLIFIVYAFILLWFTLQFTFISYIFLKDKKLDFSKIFLVASIWTIFEWSRLFFMCGFSFNQVGIALTHHHMAAQLASIIGIFGLSFYVILVNLTALKAFIDKSFKVGILWLILAAFPFLYGYFHEKIYEKKFAISDKLNVCLVQTALLPEQKNLTKNYFDSFISPMYQWKRIINFINQKTVDDLDLIVLPEAALPFSANDHFYPFEKVKDLFLEKFGADILDKLPDLKEPFARKYDDIWYVSNSYFSKALSTIYDSDFAIGLDDFDPKINQSYNAAFYFSPKIETYQRYEKQVLVPMGEYIPFAFLANIALKKYGIASSFTKGKENKIFSDKNAFSFSICYEETYPNIMRKAKNKGAKCFVNLTNDAYFYKSKLYKQHFHHAKIRAIENGIPLIRSCNTGITAGIDSFGRVIDAVYKEDKASAIFIRIPLFSYKTFYSFWGDYLILFFCTVFIISHIIRSKRKDKNI